MDPHLHQLGTCWAEPLSVHCLLLDGSVERQNAGDFCQQVACDLSGFAVMKIMYTSTNECISCVFWTTDVELRCLDYENTGSNRVLQWETMSKCFHSMLLQFRQIYECVLGNRQWWIFMYEEHSRINFIVVWYSPEKLRCVWLNRSAGNKVWCFMWN